MIQGAVGRGVTSPLRADVLVVQRLLNQHRNPPLNKIQEDGIQGPETIAAIEEFQRRVVGFPNPDGRVDPNGRTIRALSQGGGASPPPPPPPAIGNFGTYTHPNAGNVRLFYDTHAVPLNAKAAHLLQSILASINLSSARLTSTLRTYHDQARITLTQTYPIRGRGTVATWYGSEVLAACERFLPSRNIQGFADWWREYDRARGRVSSKHLSNLAMDVVPNANRARFADRVQELVPVRGSGVLRIIPMGVMNEPVDHVEFTFPVTDRAS